MILCNKRITKALIRMRGCAGRSAPLLFANTEDRVSRVQHLFFTFLPIMYQCKFDQTPSIGSEDIVLAKKLHLHYSGALRMMSGNSANSRIRLQSVMFQIKSGRKSLIVSASLWTSLNNDIRMRYRRLAYHAYSACSSMTDSSGSNLKVLQPENGVN